MALIESNKLEIERDLALGGLMGLLKVDFDWWIAHIRRKIISKSDFNCPVLKHGPRSLMCMRV